MQTILWISPRRAMRYATSGILCLSLLAAPAWAAKKSAVPPPSPRGQAAIQYVEAIGQGDATRFAQLDFACLYNQQVTSKPAASAPERGTCLDQLKPIHAEAIPQKDEGMYAQWPGRGRTVFFDRPLIEYPASAFVMDLLGQSPPGGGLDVRYEGEREIPKASFPSRDQRRTLAVPTALVRLKITYKDALTAPLAFAPGTFQWTGPVKRPRVAIRSLSLQFVVVSGLRKQGYQTDVAVMNLPVSTLTQSDAGVQEAVPFATESSRAVEESLVSWQPEDAPGQLIAAVARSRHFPELEDRIGMLNRVLVINPKQPEALAALASDLYVRILTTGDAAPPPLSKDASLTRRLAELSWNGYAQTTRMDLSLGMEMGGFAQPTNADFLYRMLPAMEKLTQVRPKDLDNLMHLGIAYRWNNDQTQAISTHETLLTTLKAARPGQRARALIELAWSRINKVSWNRQLDDPDIQQAYREAEQAFRLTQEPLDKFTAAYTMAYSQVFMPQRDINLMLENLTQAKHWFDQTPGATPAAWQFALSLENLKAVLDANPTFQPLLASTQPEKKS